jgi:L-iditol 2-dehydrogenase
MSEQSGRAAVLTEYNADFEIREYPVPEPEPGGLVVKIEVSTVCGSDVHAWEGMLEGVLPVQLPLILGHEMVGRVVSIGSGAELDSVGEPLAVGDRVIWAHPPCRHCYECTITREPTLCPNRRIGLLEDCSVAPHFTGTFAEYGYIRAESGRIRVPDPIEDRWASAGSCALRTVVNAVEKAGRFDYLDSVVVQGAGPVGLFATAIFATHSPKHLIVIGDPDDRLELAREWGATHTVSVATHPDAAARREAVLSITGTRGATVMLEASGARGAFAEGVEMLAPQARYVCVGTIGGGTQEVNVPRLTTRQLQLVGSMGAEIDGYWKAMQFLDKHRDRFDWDRMLGNEYPLTGLKDAILASRNMSEIKPVIVPALV